MDKFKYLYSLIAATQPTILVSIVGFLGVTIAAIITARSISKRDKDLSTRRILQLDHAIKRATFWETWLTAIKPLASAEEIEEYAALAKRHLETASSEMDLAVAAHDQRVANRMIALKRSRAMRRYVSSLPKWKQVVFAYKPAHFYVWIPRAAYYAFCLFAGVTLSSSVADGVREIYRHVQADRRISASLCPAQYCSVLFAEENVTHTQQGRAIRTDIEGGISLSLTVAGFLWWINVELDMGIPAYKLDD